MARKKEGSIIRRMSREFERDVREIINKREELGLDRHRRATTTEVTREIKLHPMFSRIKKDLSFMPRDPLSVKRRRNG